MKTGLKSGRICAGSLVLTAILVLTLPGSWAHSSGESPAVPFLTSIENTVYAPDETRVGIEIEYGGLTPLQSVAIIAQALDGKSRKTIETQKTTLKEILPNGTRIYNEQQVVEYVISTKQLGELLIKPDNNMVTEDDAEVNLEGGVVELVTPPLRAGQLSILQNIVTRLKLAGATGTSDSQAVSIQENVEIAEGNLAKVNWPQIGEAIRAYILHAPDIDRQLHVPAIRRQYLNQFTTGLIEKILAPNYEFTARNLYDDVIYRQSLEVLKIPRAWTMPIKEARQTLLAQPNPAVASVVKQVRLRLSSLLMWAIPDDPMTQIYEESGWAKARPLIEFREHNNDFLVVPPFKQAVGLLQGPKKNWNGLSVLGKSVSRTERNTICRTSFGN